MQATERKIDKATWPAGPWKTESDREQWVHAGLDCLMVRQPSHGAWCGYVGVPNGHPAYGKDYSEVEAEVHGGLTYSGTCQGHICHVPEPGRTDDVWWLGFDCAHAFDLCPGTEARLAFLGSDGQSGEYRDEAYVVAECNQLAEHLATAE